MQTNSVGVTGINTDWKEKIITGRFLKRVAVLNYYYYSCSGGNKRKLTTAIALIGDPPILLLVMMGEYVSTQTLVIHQWAGPSVIAQLAPDSTPDRAE